jgi:ABC-type dipeptide/oligopeptide/nickel transport system ATPase component
VRTLPGSGRIAAGASCSTAKTWQPRAKPKCSHSRQAHCHGVSRPHRLAQPVFTIGQQIDHIIRHHTGDDHEPPAAKRWNGSMRWHCPTRRRFMTLIPTAWSGGMQQRVMIAMALCSGAELLIADEPTTALDVTIQRKFWKLLVKLRDQQGISILLITHNLGVVAETCERVAVAYAGQSWKPAPPRRAGAPPAPLHEGLLAALPTAVQKGQTCSPLPGRCPTVCSPSAAARFTRAAARRCRCARRSTCPAAG